MSRSRGTPDGEQELHDSTASLEAAMVSLAHAMSAHSIAVANNLSRVAQTSESNSSDISNLSKAMHKNSKQISRLDAAVALLSNGTSAHKEEQGRPIDESEEPSADSRSEFGGTRDFFEIFRRGR